MYKDLTITRLKLLNYVRSLESVKESPTPEMAWSTQLRHKAKREYTARWTCIS